MGKIRRSFDLSFKVRVSEAIASGARSVREVCQEYQLQQATVDRWVASHVSGELSAKGRKMSKEMELERENEKLRAKVGEMTMQIDALRKADQYKRSMRSDGSWIISSNSLAHEVKLAKPSPLPAPATTGVRKDRH